ncbi:MFS transporter [Chromatium okenii]|uniref:AmpG family muropeptide MFS transporter n=1 Tax=Chromatium okenii TaxID=61644 RepID=UPI0026EFF1E3|nr:MFS transporter [Chromatium okenii]MBV5309155.1 MFS transporter [Chromatium okenii]
MTLQLPESWRQAGREFKNPRVISMLFLGFAAGIPLLLIFSSLSLWLREAGVERDAVTFFSWAALGYSFKFVWAPLIDRLPVPMLTRQLGRRRAWLLIAQLAIVTAIILMALIDPAGGADNLTKMATAAVLLGFSAATQDIVIDAYRIESAPPRLQALLSSVYIAGYRTGMVVAGAGALTLASIFGSELGAYNYAAWRMTYLLMATTVLVGLITTLLIREPEVERAATHPAAPTDYLRLLAVFLLTAAAFATSFFLTAAPFTAAKLAAGSGALTSLLLELLHFGLALAGAVLTGWLLVRVGAVNRLMLEDTWIAPVRDFFQRYGLKTAALLLALIGLYRISDIVLGVMTNVFYQDLGFTKPQIATAVQTFGVVVSIIGGVLGGLLATRYGVMRMLLLGAVVSAATNLIFVVFTQTGAQLGVLYFAVSADNLAAGFASAVFIAFLSSLTNVSFTAVQYAIFSSLMTLLPKLLGGYSGSIVENVGYPSFFLLTTLIGIPVIGLVWLAGQWLAIRDGID